MAEKAILVNTNNNKEITKKEKLPPLALCIFLDALGCINYLFPGFGEFTDTFWAPISALLFNYLFGGKLGKIGAVLNFIEEIVPFTDIIPSFTIAYFIRKNDNKK